MKFHYERLQQPECLMLDGYSKVSGYFGPFRINKNVMYYSPSLGGYISAKTLYKTEGKL
jgi:hypothetical protein